MRETEQSEIAFRLSHRGCNVHRIDIPNVPYDNRPNRPGPRFTTATALECERHRVRSRMRRKPFAKLVLGE